MEEPITPAEEGTQGNPSTTAEIQTETQERPPQVEGNGSAPEVIGGNGREFNVQNYVNASKRVTDGIKKDIAEQKQVMQEILARLAPPAVTPAPSASSPEVDIFTNPEAYVDKRVSNALNTRLEQKLGERDLRDQQRKAEEYILSQDYIDPESEADRAEIKKIHQEAGFAYAWGVTPFAAANGILEIFKARKGIGKSTPNRVQAAAAPSGAAPNANGKRVWTSKEVSALSMKDYDTHRSDIEAAYKEGRFRE